jgi:hypothetical protein
MMVTMMVMVMMVMVMRYLSLVSDIDYEGFPRWRQKMFFLVTHDYFDLAIAVVIGVNVLCMAMEHYNQPEVFIPYSYHAIAYHTFKH